MSVDVVWLLLNSVWVMLVCVVCVFVMLRYVCDFGRYYMSSGMSSSGFRLLM